MSIHDIFPIRDIPPRDGMPRDQFLYGYNCYGDIEDVVEAIADILGDEGVEARVEYELVGSYSVPDEIIEKYGIDSKPTYDPGYYSSTVYRIEIACSDRNKARVYYVPELCEHGYFFRSLRDAKRAAKKEIKDLILYLEWWYDES